MWHLSMVHIVRSPHLVVALPVDWGHLLTAFFRLGLVAEVIRTVPFQKGWYGIDVLA